LSWFFVQLRIAVGFAGLFKNLVGNKIVQRINVEKGEVKTEVFFVFTQ
jgi:hypothetical protein